MERKSVNLSDEDAKVLGPYLQPGPKQEALARFVGEESPAYSDSSALRTLAMIGARAVEAGILQRGYEELAAHYSDEDAAMAEASLDFAATAWRE